MKFTYQINGTEHTLTLEKQPEGYRARLGDAIYEVRLLHTKDGQLHFQLDETRHTAHLAHETPTKRWLHSAGRTLVIEKAAAHRRGAETAAGSGRLTAPMPGQVRAVLVAIGDKVTAGQPLLLMEAMKMEIRIAAPHAGRITVLHATEGGSVNKDDLLIEVEEIPA